MDLSKLTDKKVVVKFTGGREGEYCAVLHNPSIVHHIHVDAVMGSLKGYDPLVNLVLDDAVEYLRDPEDPYRLTGQTRKLGLVVCRGSAVMLISPADGKEEIVNPFLNAGEAGDE